jgi:dihydrofolate reductase
MPSPARSLPLTLILAATPSLGIGKNGTLPWPQLKKEMGYFARVTNRVPSSQRGKINAVIMGRKTWDSIPEKFRPLKGRLNVVITRVPANFTAARSLSQANIEGPLAVGSLESALEKLGELSESAEGGRDIHRVFVIGGSSIYNAALALPQTDRVLLTSIEKEYECDTFFEASLGEGSGWVKKAREEVEEWTGETLQEAGVEEAGVKFAFGMWERMR